MFSIATTRFTTKTLLERDAWCKKHGWTGSIYGTPLKITEKIPYGSLLFVLEMNNETNKIVGIGLVKNTLVVDKYYKIYSDGNYNRYVYKGLYRIDSSNPNLTEYEKKVIEIFNVLLFKGLRNVKRYQGITALPKWIANSKHMDFIQFFRELFKAFEKSPPKPM
uniref:Uncharacterized protein n=1 Tax=viral metagenome TaxID=1070528 RepID=A0A6C0HHR3_9ZZZZ